MNDFYVYVHKRKSDGSIFYVGKGSGNRAWDVGGRSSGWMQIAVDNGREVHIVADKLNEQSALLLESMLISIYREELVNVLAKGAITKPSVTLGRAIPFRVHLRTEYYQWRFKGKKSEYASIADMVRKYGSTYRQWNKVVNGHKRNNRGWAIDRRYRDEH